MYQPWIAVNTPLPPPDVGAHVRLRPRAGAVGEVVALAMDAVERVGRAREADRVDVLELQLARGERLPGRDPRELLARSPARGGRTSTSRRRRRRRAGSSAHHRDRRRGRRNPAPGLRHADAGVARAEPFDAREGAGEAVRLPEVALAERAAARVDPIGVEALEPERIEMLELLVRVRVVDLRHLDVRRARSPRGRTPPGRPARRPPRDPTPGSRPRERPGSSRRRR